MLLIHLAMFFPFAQIQHLASETPFRNAKKKVGGGDYYYFFAVLKFFGYNTILHDFLGSRYFFLYPLQYRNFFLFFVVLAGFFQFSFFFFFFLPPPNSFRGLTYFLDTKFVIHTPRYFLGQEICYVFL